ncbi:hypothetical protein [Salipiger sp.]|uniref:hypothetical protein n=1 Tax=Salipiger sp. TaxID=2078585 RepID=UPI003A977D84
MPTIPEMEDAQASERRADDLDRLIFDAHKIALGVIVALVLAGLALATLSIAAKAAANTAVMLELVGTGRAAW